MSQRPVRVANSTCTPGPARCSRRRLRRRHPDPHRRGRRAGGRRAQRVGPATPGARNGCWWPCPPRAGPAQPRFRRPGFPP